MWSPSHHALYRMGIPVRDFYCDAFIRSHEAPYVEVQVRVLKLVFCGLVGPGLPNPGALVAFDHIAVSPTTRMPTGISSVLDTYSTPGVQLSLLESCLSGLL